MAVRGEVRTYVRGPAATGLQQPQGEPLVHRVDRTHALIGRPTLDQPAATAKAGGDFIFD